MAARAEVVAAILAAASGCGGRTTDPVVPVTEARRIAAEWTGARSCVPTWAPSGALGDRHRCGAGNDRLGLRLSRHGAVVDWGGVTFARACAAARSHRLRPPRPSCPFRPRPRHGATAFTCIPCHAIG